jgi:hypothetical protein
MFIIAAILSALMATAVFLLGPNVFEVMRASTK